MKLSTPAMAASAAGALVVSAASGQTDLGRAARSDQSASPRQPPRNPLPLTSVQANTPQGALESLQRWPGSLSGSGERDAQRTGDRASTSTSARGVYSQPTIVGGSSPATNPQAFEGNFKLGMVSAKHQYHPAALHHHRQRARYMWRRASRFSSTRTARRTPVPSKRRSRGSLYGRRGARMPGSCNITQPSFATSPNRTTTSFSAFQLRCSGAGLVENIDDSTLLANLAAQAQNNGLGISGTFNRSGMMTTRSPASVGKRRTSRWMLFLRRGLQRGNGHLQRDSFRRDRPLPGEEIMAPPALGLPANCVLQSGAKRLSGGQYQLSRPPPRAAISSRSTLRFPAT